MRAILLHVVALLATHLLPIGNVRRTHHAAHLLLLVAVQFDLVFALRDLAIAEGIASAGRPLLARVLDLGEHDTPSAASRLHFVALSVVPVGNTVTLI